jgi:hypothetical protein
MTVRRLSIAVVASLCILVAGADKPDAANDKQPAAPLNTLTDKEKADGWQLLFDGKSIDQWRRYNGNGQPPGANWKVVDVTLMLTPGGGDIVTKEQFDSFELSLDYAIAPGGNSGVMFHVQEMYREPGMSGPEIQILDNERARESQMNGWLYGLYQPPADPKAGKPVDASKPAGQWNHLRLLVDGPKVEIELNGVKYISCEMWSDDWNQRVAKSKFVQWDQYGKARTGHIDLQDHGAPVAFRNIKIRPIKKG